MFGKSLFEHRIIFDNAIVNDCQFFGLRIMRVCIFLIGFTVGCPAGMCNSDGSCNIFLFGKMFQISYFAFRLVNIQFVIINKCNTGTVVSAIFEPVKSLNQYRVGLLVAHITNYSTHII